MTDPDVDERVRQTELIISYTLRAGVSMSLGVILLGICVTFIRHPEYWSSRSELSHLTHIGATFPHTIRDVLGGLREFRGQSMVVAGLLLLILTPVVRVAISIPAFVYQKDKIFVGITTIVLMLLLLSFTLGHVAG